MFYTSTPKVRYYTLLPIEKIAYFMKLGVWEQLAKQGVPRWQVHKRVAGGSQRRGAKRPVDVCPAPSLRRTQCTNFWVVYNCTLSKLRGFRLLPFQHAATGTEPVCPFLSGKLFQLVLQCLFIIDGFPQFLFAFFQLPVEFFQL